MVECGRVLSLVVLNVVADGAVWVRVGAGRVLRGAYLGIGCALALRSVLEGVGCL